MSIYSNLMTTEVLETSYHSNSRSEFRLRDGKVFSSNLRLANVGLVRAAGSDAHFCASSGVGALIRRATLYDGNQQLDHVEDAHRVLGFKNLLKSNSYNNAIEQAKNKSTLGFISAYTAIAPGGAQLLRGSYSNHTLIAAAQGGQCTNDANTTAKGLLSLKDLFGFLQNTNYLDANLFKNLRVVIEWRPQAELPNCLQGNNGVNAGNITQPQLYVDHLEDPEAVEQIMNRREGNIPYYAIESERIQFSAAGSGVVVNESFRSNAFEDKYVDKIMLDNVDNAILELADADNVSKSDGSLAMKEEKIQLIVNGKRLLDFSGADSDARKTALLVDSWGNTNQPLLSNKHQVNQKRLITPNGSQPYRLIAVVGGYGSGVLSYGGVNIKDRVKDFQLQYERKGKVGGDPAFDLHVFGRVSKNVAFKDGSYRVSYA